MEQVRGLIEWFLPVVEIAIMLSLGDYRGLNFIEKLTPSGTRR